MKNYSDGEPSYIFLFEQSNNKIDKYKDKIVREEINKKTEIRNISFIKEYK